MPTVTYCFYGVYRTMYKMDNILCKVTEDNGYYRTTHIPSATTGLEAIRSKFPITPLATVVYKGLYEEHGFKGFNIIDCEDKHIWLHAGVDLNNKFVFEYTPKKAGVVDKDGFIWI